MVDGRHDIRESLDVDFGVTRDVRNRGREDDLAKRAGRPLGSGTLRKYADRIVVDDDRIDGSSFRTVFLNRALRDNSLRDRRQHSLIGTCRGLDRRRARHQSDGARNRLLLDRARRQRRARHGKRCASDVAKRTLATR